MRYNYEKAQFNRLESKCICNKEKSVIFIVCSDGTFGKNCTEQCGECLGKGKCDHVNGTCVNGCNPGYQGITCTEGGQS